MPRRISVRLHEALKGRLERIARRTGHSKSFHVRQALIAQLPDLEDLYFARKVAKRVAVGRERAIPLEQLERDLSRDA